MSFWLSETEVLDSLTPLQLDVYHALWNFYHRRVSDAQSRPSRKLRHLNRAEALQVFRDTEEDLATSGSETRTEVQVYDYFRNRWRSMYWDDEWEELTRR